MAYVFISYSSKNQVAADHFKKILDQNGIRSWMAPGDIPLGSKYAQVISKAIKESSGLLLLMTDNAQNSVWVAKEVERAINYHKPLIPVMLEDVILNDEFEFYICNDQGISVNQIDENTQEMQQVLAILHKITSEDGSQEAVARYIVAKTPRMKRRLWLKRGLAGLLALLIFGLGIGISNLDRFYHKEPESIVPTISLENTERDYGTGRMYEDQTPPKLEDALVYYLQAAEGHYAPSYLAVGRVSMELKQYSQAKKYLEMADDYYPAAYALLGKLYEEGLDVDKNLEQAVEYYQDGHDQKDRDATCALARMYASAPEGSGLELNLDTAIQLYKEAVRDNHPESMFRLGLLYESSDKGKAIELMKEAYKLGYMPAEYRLSELLPEDEMVDLRSYRHSLTGEYVEMSASASEEPLIVQTPDNTEEVLRKAKDGDIKAMLEAASLYYSGSEEHDIAVDHAQARDYLLAAGDRVYENADAMMILAYYYEGNENVVDVDIDKAVDLYTKAADAGNLMACYRLAKGYGEGALNNGVPDYEKSFRWAYQGADKGHPNCMNVLGVIYGTGGLSGGVPDYAMAEKWYLESAKRGFVTAMTNLGLNYYEGDYSNGVPNYDEAYRWLMEAVKQNDPKAMNALGVGYYKGNFNNGIPDYQEAQEWYQQATDLKYSSAMYNTGIGYVNGNFSNGTPNYEEALKWFRDAAELEHSSAMQYIAEYYENGKFNNGTPDYEEAKTWFEKAANKGKAHSMYHLGRGFANGNYNGGVPDYTTAAEWYGKAAEQNDEKSLVELAKLYLNGKKDQDGDVLFAVNHAEGFRLLEKLSELGTEDTYVLSWLGWFYAGNSEVLEADYAKSIEYYEAAAKLGDAYSMHQLGSIYRDGRLGEPDYKTAEQWYLDAAELGYSSSMFRLGYGYSNGEFEDTPDYQNALKWYTEAAKQNYSRAMYNLGVGYENGKYNAGEPDYATAAEWYEKAAELNYENAIAQLADLYLAGPYDENGEPLIERNLEKGLFYFDKLTSMELKSTYALCTVGWLYYYADEGVECDTKKAVEYFEAAANLGDVYAMNMLGHIYGDSYNDLEKAMGWLKEAAKLNHAQSMVDLAYCYMYYLDESDGDKAVGWLKEAVKLNHVEAMVELAGYYMYFLDEPNLDEAEYWLNQALATELDIELEWQIDEMLYDLEKLKSE